MPDNWTFVAAAYALAAVALGGYWRYLVRREKELTALADSAGTRAAGRRQPSFSGQPPSKPASRAPLQP